MPSSRADHGLTLATRGVAVEAEPTEAGESMVTWRDESQKTLESLVV
jgi:hypothetical protein